MIKLTKQEINSLILNYFKQESFIYSSFVFKSEIKEEVKTIRKDISLEKILTYGLQYMYGVEHYKDGKINTCNGVYSLDRLHLCDVVVKKKKKRGVQDENKTSNSSEGNRKKEKREDSLVESKSIVEIENIVESKGIVESKSIVEAKSIVESNGIVEQERIKEEIKEQERIKEEIKEQERIKEEIKEQERIKEEIKEQERLKSIILDFSPSPSPTPLDFSVKSLAPCKPCIMATLYDEYLYLYAESSLYTFKFGSFVGVKSLNITNILYTDDILIMYDGSKLIFYNTFNLKSKSVMYKCIKILYDGTKFVCLNLDGTISYFSRDGIKVMENIFIFSNIVDGCIEENTLLVWNEEGRVCMINTKTQSIFHYKGRGKAGAYSFYEGILYLATTPDNSSNKSIVGVYNTMTKYESEISLTSITGLCKTRKYLLAYKDNILTVYNEDTCTNYDTRRIINKIVNIKGNILIVFSNTLSFYDEDIQLIKDYECEDEILNIEIYEKEICVLLKKESPFLINL